MIIKTLPVTKQIMDSMPADERALFIHIGHIRNELLSLYKITTWTTNAPIDEPITTDVNPLQMYTFARLVAGKIFEAWKVVWKGYIDKGLDASVGVKLHPEGKAAYNKLYEYFFGNNPTAKRSIKRSIINEVRNKLSFHYDYDYILENNMLLQLDEDFSLSIYLAEHDNNNYYQYAEYYVAAKMFEATPQLEIEEAMTQFVDETQKLSGYLFLFCDACMKYFLDTYFDFRAAHESEIRDDFDFTKVQIPFFAKMRPRQVQ